MKLKDNLVFGTIGIFGVAVIAGLILVGDVVSAEVLESSEIGAAVTVTEACTMSGSGMNSHTAEIANGTYTPDIGSTTINAVCNDNLGFAIYATGFTGDVVAETNSNKLVGTSTSGNSTIVTGTATSAGNPDISNWAMKLTASSGTGVNYPLTISTGYNAYHEVPNTWTKVATRTAGTDVGTNAEGSTMTTTYAAYISKTQAADTYTGKVKYTLVHPSDGAAPKVPPAAPTSCNTPVPNITYMQDITSSNKSTVLASLTEEAPYYLRDSRDEEPYCVSKLKDGNLWLLDNLRLNLNDSDVLASVTASNTNASATSLNYMKNGGGTTSDQYPTAPLNNEVWASSSQDYFSIPMTTSTYIDQTVTSYGNGSGKIGMYYNFCAASAGSYCYGDGASEGTSVGNATEDLCPAGWRMPTGGASGEYLALYGYYNATQRASDNASLQYNLSIPMSGDFIYGKAVNLDSVGGSWSSYRLLDYSMSTISATLSKVQVSASNRRYGQTMRCLLQ